MSRTAFIKSQGATCNNFRNAWSFINKKKKTILFGAWDNRTEGNTTLILSEDWKVRRGRKSSAYDESRENIRLIEEEGYKLKTFPMEHSDGAKDESGIGPAKIGKLIPILTDKKLIRIGNNWYASDGVASNIIPEEIENPSKYIEGASKTIAVNAYERNRKARTKCLNHHGHACTACRFDFSERYGEIGQGFIHVHHLKPLSEIRAEYELDPIRDLVPVCANCHAIIHCRTPALTIEELKEHLGRK